MEDHSIWIYVHVHSLLIDKSGVSPSKSGNETLCIFMLQIQLILPYYEVLFINGNVWNAEEQLGLCERGHSIFSHGEVAACL